MTQHAMENRRTLHRTKTLGRGDGKAGIPGDRVVYTGLSRSLEGEREEGGGKGGSEEDGSDSKQCWKEKGGEKGRVGGEERQRKGRRRRQMDVTSISQDV